VWGKGAVKMTPKVRREVIDYIKAPKPLEAQGGTNIYDSLMAGLKNVKVKTENSLGDQQNGNRRNDMNDMKDIIYQYGL
jgi:hypothetical protein